MLLTLPPIGNDCRSLHRRNLAQNACRGVNGTKRVSRIQKGLGWKSKSPNVRHLFHNVLFLNHPSETRVVRFIGETWHITLEEASMRQKEYLGSGRVWAGSQNRRNTRHPKNIVLFCVYGPAPIRNACRSLHRRNLVQNACRGVDGTKRVPLIRKGLGWNSKSPQRAASVSS